MKKILVPTDFSENAAHALNYAIELAKKEHATLILLHVYHLDPAPPYLDVRPPEQEIDTEEKRWLNKLKALQVKVDHAGHVKTELVARLDLAVDGIAAEAKEKEVDLIVMGTKGASGLKEVLMGSNTSRVIDRVSCPVIAVPEQAKAYPVKKIAYACDYRQLDLEAIQKLLEIARPFNAQVNVLHVYESDEAIAKEEMERFVREVGNKINYSNLSFELLGGEDIEERLEKYLASEATDLLVLSTHQRGLLDRLFKKSITRKLVFHSKVPVMAFHYQKKESTTIV